MKQTAGYLKNSIPGFILCVLISCSIAFTIQTGFYIRASVQFDYPLLICMVAVLTAVCTLGAYNRRTLIAAIILYVVGFLVFVMIARSSSSGNIFRDDESNPYLYFIIVSFTAVLVFLLTRRRWGCGLLFVAGSVVLSSIQFLYEKEHLPALILFLCSCGAMYIYINYERNVLRSQTVKTAFARTFLISCGVSILVVALGLGIYMSVVRALDPPSHDLKLITKYVALETLQKIGIADYNEILDPEMLTQREEEEARKAEEDRKKKEKQQNSEEEENQKDHPENLDNSNDQGFNVVNYLTEWFRVWMIPILVLILILAAVFFKKYRRKKWIRAVLEKDRKDQVRLLYGFFMKSFAKLQIRKRPSETLPEFIESQRPQLAAFSSGTAAFEGMTDVYMGTLYGRKDVTDDEMKSYLAFYRDFYSNALNYLGKVKYMIKYFTL